MQQLFRQRCSAKCQFSTKKSKNKARENEVLQNAFMLVYWLAKEEIANKKFLSLLALLQMLGLENMKHFRHCSPGSAIKIFWTLGRVLKQRVVEALRKSKAFRLLVAEVTDISVMEQLIGFAQMSLMIPRLW